MATHESRRHQSWPPPAASAAPAPSLPGARVASSAAWWGGSRAGARGSGRPLTEGGTGRPGQGNSEEGAEAVQECTVRNKADA